MIYCIGDSFTAGEELPGWPNQFNNEQYPTHPNAWPGLLEQKLNHPVTNWGRGGCGNIRIIKRAMDAVTSRAEIVIVSWTSAERLELADDVSIFDYWRGRNTSRMRAKEIREDVVDWLTMYQNKKELDKWYLTAWLRQIILLQSFFKVNNQRYIMLSSLPYNHYSGYLHEFDTLVDLIDSTYFIDWPKWSMMDWAYGLPKGQGGHFLEEGHQVVAEKVNEYIRRLGWIS